jgi:hypothetical protein
VGNVEIFAVNSGGKQSSLVSPILSSPATDWTLPFGTTSGAYYTGYSIVNSNELLTVQTDVTVEVIGSDGVVVSRTPTSLSPRHRITGIMPKGIQSGYLRIRSNLPVYVMGSIGTESERQMDQIPALR